MIEHWNTPEVEETKTRIGIPKQSGRLSDDELSVLIHKVGHEIGNPLTAIISLATIIERFSRECPPTESDANKSANYAGSIIEEAWKIGALNERLVMLLSQKSANSGPTDLRRLLDKVIQKRQMRMRIPKEGVVVSVLGETPIVALADAEHISVLVGELLQNAHNALAYDFPDDGTSRPTTVMLRNEGKSCVLTITNDAAHPFPGELASIFDLFQTTYAERKHLGIGLSMCQAIASRYDGTLRAIEQPRREIYSFTLELSLPQAEQI